jgi:NTP pyrophosphatase (non-canonical NTP hydrolase)
MKKTQQELFDWQCKNFPESSLMDLPKEELVRMIKILQMTLGMCEEVGEVAHAVLKGSQKIREGVNGFPKDLVCDGIGDNHIYANQLLSFLEISMEECVRKTVSHVLKRDWTNNPLDGKNQLENE